MEKGHLYFSPSGFACAGNWQEVRGWLAVLEARYETMGQLSAALHGKTLPNLSLLPLFDTVQIKKRLS